jgi:hypothetical protein
MMASLLVNRVGSGSATLRGSRMTQSQHVPNVSDERLCWLSIRGSLDKKARKLSLFGVLTVIATASRGRGSARLGSTSRRDEASEKFADYAFAVDDAANNLTPEERKHLRSTGEVPAWFLSDVEQRAAEIRKSRKKG